jgi:Transposase DDE domain
MDYFSRTSSPLLTSRRSTLGKYGLPGVGPEARDRDVRPATDREHDGKTREDEGVDGVKRGNQAARSGIVEERQDVDNREWVKVHLMCGVETNIVTSVEISGWAAHDSPFFEGLVETTAEYFRAAEVSADKAYSGRANLAAVASIGATPYIPFRENTPEPALTDDSTWVRMYHYYAFNRAQFLPHYHKRSNVETVFSMIKGKFGDAVRGKSDTAQINEVLCKVLCHNICVLVQSIHELGIEPTFGAVAQTA